MNVLVKSLEAYKKPPEDITLHLVGERLVIDEWKEQREKYLVKQQQIVGVLQRLPFRWLVGLAQASLATENRAFGGLITVNFAPKPPKAQGLAE